MIFNMRWSLSTLFLSLLIVFTTPVKSEEKVDWFNLGTELHNYRSCNFSGLYEELGEAFKVISNSRFKGRQNFMKGYDAFRSSNKSCNRSDLMSLRKKLKLGYGRLGIKNLKYQYDFSSAETTQKNNVTFSHDFEREYNKFAKLIFEIEGKSYESLTGYREMKEPGGYTAEGTFAFEGNICQWQSKVTDVSSKEGEFNAQCPNGMERFL